MFEAGRIRRGQGVLDLGFDLVPVVRSPALCGPSKAR
ncbi:hypothetical protein BIFADO_01888 [Bifidobacterium adolescentis L2-32]|uniref:Uncharacterized protein n=1 Tax=Bifidobacterium adolescentis L2-32 TaxID=411481 RepID=A7A7P9_BIFAD|nr:hypothetical protein BIFADO_01888 [Bifidobacterium adolescentis L2-32]